jgi:hypothetical protein
MSSSIIQSAQALTETIALRKHKKENTWKQEQKYNEIKSELEKEYSLYLAPAKFIKAKSRKGSIKQIQETEKVDNMQIVINALEAFDNSVNNIIALASQKQSSLNIGNAHTFIESIRVILRERRIFKCKAITYDTSDYHCRSTQASSLLSTFKLPNGFKIDKVKECPNIMIMNDLKHFCEKVDKIALDKAYVLLKELIRLHHELQSEKLENLLKLF